MNIRLKEEIISVESNVCDVHCPARVQNEFIENFMKFFCLVVPHDLGSSFSFNLRNFNFIKVNNKIWKWKFVH